MLKIKRFQVKCKFPVMNLPLMGQIKEFPFPAALFTAVIVPVWLLPILLCLRRVPDDLRIRADQKIIPPALQLDVYKRQPWEPVRI